MVVMVVIFFAVWCVRTRYVPRVTSLATMVNGQCTGCGKKSSPVIFCNFLNNLLRIFDETLQLYSMFILQYKMQNIATKLNIYKNVAAVAAAASCKFKKY